MSFRSNSVPYSNDTQFDANGIAGCIGFTIFNKGTCNMNVFNGFPLNPGDAPLTIDGVIGVQRSDVVDVRFVGSGTKKAFIFYTVDTELAAQQRSK